MTYTKECRFCRYVDMSRANKIGQVRCRRFSTYVNIFEWCDYYFPNKSISDFIPISELSEVEK